MASNEHPDMHGNPADLPITCHSCDRIVDVDQMYGSSLNEEFVFCSASCVEDFEESKTPADIGS
jgi:hypothetical protein